MNKYTKNILRLGQKKKSEKESVFVCANTDRIKSWHRRLFRQLVAEYGREHIVAIR